VRNPLNRTTTMENEIKKTLTNTLVALEKEQSLLNELRVKLIKAQKYEFVGNIIGIESILLHEQDTICNLLSSLQE
jgi:hypothetical protein